MQEKKCVVFSNFKAYDMNLTANPPYGVKSLKEFLEYAENLTLGTNNQDAYTKEPFEDAIASFLEENGYTVDRQIGCAGFRVDLAIVDDENPGKYILGITTDGKMYASSKVARDRDRLREQVLTGLGWKLYHLWSTDWYRNRDLGRKKLLDSVQKSIAQTREEEKRRSEEEKKLAEKRRIEAEKKAEELRLAREKEEAERKAKEEAENAEEIAIEDIGPADFVEVEKVDDGDIFEKPIDVSEIDPEEFFDDVINEEKEISETPSEFVVNENVEDNSHIEDDASEFVVTEDVEDNSHIGEDVSEFVVTEDVEDTSSVKEDASEFENIDDVEVHETSEVETDSQSRDNEEISEPVGEDIDQSADEDVEINADEEVWESDEGVSPEDNAEVWENDKDYSDEEDQHSFSKSFTNRVKSFLKSDEDENEEGSAKNSFFSSLKFEKDLGENSDLGESITSDVDEITVEDVVEDSVASDVDEITVEDVVEDSVASDVDEITVEDVVEDSVASDVGDVADDMGQSEDDYLKNLLNKRPLNQK